jgi:putative transcriptional regulator
MPIAVDIVMLARRKMCVGELADRVGITPANLAGLKNGRAKAARFATLAALCEALECQPGELLRWEAEDVADGMASPRGSRDNTRCHRPVTQRPGLAGHGHRPCPSPAPPRRVGSPPHQRPQVR